MFVAATTLICYYSYESSECAPRLEYFNFMLHDDELHVWRVGLELADDDFAEFSNLLSTDEHRRAARFHFENDRRRFTAGRGALRFILARYLCCAGNEITFVYGVRGKPALADAPLHFNLAHSEGLAVIGVTRSGPLGIDVERLRPVDDFMCIASSYFSPTERKAIAALPPEHQLLAFFTCWTRKEAYLKATGEGITTPLDSFDVTVAPCAPPKLLRREGAPNETARWSFQDLPLGADYLGAVAFDDQIHSVQHRVWPHGERISASTFSSLSR